MSSNALLFLSPHFDDVAFSCGGVFHALASRGWACHLATIFTQSVPSPQGFALACQTDKGLAPEVDYMAIRRQEDARAARAMGAHAVHTLDFPEAPHRGYHSAAALFGGRRSEEHLSGEIAQAVRALEASLTPRAIFVPQGLGGHVDHRLSIQSVQGVCGRAHTVWYQDAPYVWRDPSARVCEEVWGSGLQSHCAPLSPADMQAKVHASCAYKTQLNFQFGGPEQAQRQLMAYAQEVAQGSAQWAERFMLTPAAHDWLQSALRAPLVAT